MYTTIYSDKKLCPSERREKGQLNERKSIETTSYKL